MAPRSPTIGVVALRQRGDEIVRGGVARGFFDLGVRGAGAAERDIGAHGVVEQRRFLRHQRDRGAQAGERHVAHVLPIDAHGAAADVVESRQQIEDGGFARARRADQRHGFARRDGEAHARERRRFAIGERDVVERDFARGDAPSGLAPGLSAIVDGLIDQRENALQRGARLR